MAIGIEWMLACYCLRSSSLIPIPFFLSVIPYVKKIKNSGGRKERKKETDSLMNPKRQTSLDEIDTTRINLDKMV